MGMVPARSIVSHSAICKDGAMLFLPPSPSHNNLESPDIHAASVQKYPVGTLAWYPGVGKKFRYCCAAEDITEATSARLLGNASYTPSAVAAGFSIAANAHGYNGLAYAQSEIGDMHVDIDLTSIAVNWFEGAHLQLLPGANPISQYYVIASDASEAAYTRLYLDKPLTQTLTVAMYVGVNASPYKRLVNGDHAFVGAHYMSFIGLPFVNADSGEFFWVQTAGPCLIQPGSWADDRLPGRAPAYREVFAQVDGAIVSPWTNTAYTDGKQRVGYLLDATAHEYGSVFIMLQLES